MDVNKVDVDWVKRNDKSCLSIKIQGYLGEGIAKDAVQRWKKEIDTQLNSGEKVNIICNCIHMNGYHTEARKMWQETISSLKSQINCMWVVTDNKMFSIAANTMGLMTKFQIKTVKCEADICLN